MDLDVEKHETPEKKVIPNVFTEDDEAAKRRVGLFLADLCPNIEKLQKYILAFLLIKNDLYALSEGGSLDKYFKFIIDKKISSWDDFYKCISSKSTVRRQRLLLRKVVSRLKLL